MKDDTTVEMTEDEKLIKSAKDCFEKYTDRESDNIRRAEEAIKFRAGEQWPDAIRRDRENEHQEGGSRPCPVLDKTDQYVRQIVNEERLNRAAIKIRPVDDNADPKTAEIFTGIIRHIEDASEALVAYTTAGEHAIDGGFGYFRILPEYASDMSFNQEIRIKRVHNRFSVAPGYHTESDGADMQECVIYEDMLRADFKKEFPDAKEVPFEQNEDWADKDTIKVAEYFYIEKEKTTIHLMDTGEVFTNEDLEKIKEEAALEGIDVPEPVDSRETLINKVKWCKLTSEEILDSKDLPGHYIPVIKVSGNEATMPDGKIRLSGAVESSMDAQRLHNYSHAGFIEHVALAPRAPWVAEASQVENYEADYSEANRKPIALLKYDAVSEDGHLIPPPQRTPPPGMSMGWQQIMQNTEHGIEAAFGMYGAQVGASGPERSGIALQEQKAQGAIGQFHFPDNLARSIQHCGRILLEWIPVYYDSANIARILGEDGEQEIVKLDPDQPQSVAPEFDEFDREVGQIYNLTVGQYDVTVSTGPSYSAKRQEAVDTQTQIISAAPELMQVMGDILFSNMDAPGADKIAERLKTLLPPEIKQLEDAKAQNIDPKTIEAMAQVEQAAAAIEERSQQLLMMEQEIQKQAQEVSADKTELDAATKNLNSEMKILNAKVQEQKANLELIGYKLVQQLEDVTDPIVQQLSQQTQEVEIENEETGEPETIVVQDPAMQEILQNIALMTQQSAQVMAETVNNALVSINESISQPRQTTLQVDEMGNPVGSVSEPL